MEDLGIILYLICLVGAPISTLVLITRAIMKKRVGKNTVASGLFLLGLITGVVMILRSQDIEEGEIEARVKNDSIVSEGEDVLYGNDETEWDNLGDEQDDVDTSNAAEIVLFDIPEYPYQNQKDAEKLMKTYNKAMEAPITDFICVEEVSKGGIIREKEIHYKKTIDDKRAAYRYYGKINKEGVPDGTGILFTVWPPEWQSDGTAYTTICYIGGFKNGYKDGYGIEYWELSGDYMVKYEGQFEKGNYHGEGIEYLYDVSGSYDSIETMRKEIFAQTEGNTLMVEPILLSFKRYEGDFKNGEYDGKGKQYFGVRDDKAILHYEGEWTKGRYNGKGKLYFDNGNVQYKGELKNGHYNGKGTLYDEQGNVVHKGEFKNGDIK